MKFIMTPAMLTYFPSRSLYDHKTEMTTININVNSKPSIRRNPNLIILYIQQIHTLYYVKHFIGKPMKCFT
jgi:hypothetical protein